MRKVIVIIITFFLFVTKLNAQTAGVADTLAYLKTIEANKNFYIGKPFSELMDSLKIQIKFFSSFREKFTDITKETSTTFSFYFPNTPSEFGLTFPKLEIYWRSYLNATQSNILYNTNNGGGWENTIKNFYSTGIIADIKVVEW